MYATNKLKIIVVGGEAQYLRVVFTSEESQNKVIDVQISKAITVLRELNRSVVTNWF